MLAALTCLVGYVLPYARALDFFAVLLSVIAAIYVGVALAGATTRMVALQSAVALGFVILGLAGLWYSPLWLIAGYFLHGLWDALYHWREHKLQLPRWYPPACIVYDWLVGGFVLYLWVSMRGLS